MWETLCRRTNDPKLAVIERILANLGIAHRRNGESFHAPILEVPEADSERAWALLGVTLGDLADSDDPDVAVMADAIGEATLIDLAYRYGLACRFDDVPDNVF